MNTKWSRSSVGLPLKTQTKVTKLNHSSYNSWY